MVKHADLYTDGSYNRKGLRYGLGAVIVENGREIERFHGSRDAVAGDAWNVTAEVFAATMGIKRAVELGYGDITVYSDYIGIGYWPDGKWSCGAWYNQEYADYVNSLRDGGITITFAHVRGHSGNEWNEMADREAKLGAGVALLGISEIAKISFAKDAPEADVKLPAGLTVTGESSIRKFLAVKAPTARDYLSLRTGGFDEW